MKFLTSQMTYLLREKDARRNLAGLAKYLLFLGAVIVVFAVIFHWIMEYEGRQFSWVTGFYWTLTVMSTLGFGDITFESDLGRAFSIFVLITGIILLLIVLPFAFIRFFYAPWLEAQVHARAPRSLSEDVSKHVLICHYDTIAQGLCDRLKLLNIPYFVIEPDPRAAAHLHMEGVPVVSGEIDSVATYSGARIESARAVFANVDDATNTNITLTIREKNTTVPIIATVEQLDSLDLVELAGATHVLALKHRLGEQLANRVNARHCEAHIIGSLKHLQVAEFPAHNTPLVGMSVRDTGLRQKVGVSVVGVWERGRLIAAHADTVLTDTSVPVVVGTSDQIAMLNESIERFDVNDNPVVVIGGGKVGRAAVGALKARGVPVHLVEHDSAIAAKSEGIADKVFVGEAADREVLERAGIAKAPSVVLTTNDDAINIYLCIYCRRLNPELRIVSRITHDRNMEAIHRAGTDFVLTYASLGLESVLALIQGRELVFVGEGVGFYSFATPTSLVGKTLLESDIGMRSGLNIVAIEQGDTLLSNPPAKTRLLEGSQLFAIGSGAQRKQFHKEFG